jgi:hypothetical protein
VRRNNVPVLLHGRSAPYQQVIIHLHTDLQYKLQEFLNSADYFNELHNAESRIFIPVSLKLYELADITHAVRMKPGGKEMTRESREFNAHMFSRSEKIIRLTN